MNGIAIAIIAAITVVTILFQAVYMTISPKQWVRSKYALKSRYITEEVANRKGGERRLRIQGFLVIIGITYFVWQFIKGLTTQ